MKVTQKIKNFLKGRKLKGRYLLLGGLFLTAAFLAIPQHVFAQWYLNALSTIFSPLIGGLLALLLKLAGLFLGWMTQAVGWAIGNPFNISYTRPGPIPPDNFVIEIGWTLLRDLVNMSFILGLAYIGLSTALDFGNKFNTTKTFFKLILIALLVNFTPAICGAVVDIGNILGSFFTQGADFSALKDIFSRQQGKINAEWAHVLSDSNILLNTVMLIAFGFVSALILFVYLILFIARGPIIWILVILSPVAFFAFIFDQTKKHFDKWWHHFIQWALLMPVTLGFFLYLAQQMLVRVNEVMNAAGSSPTGFINQVVPYALPVGILGIGLFLGTTVLMPGGGAAILGAGGALVGAAGAGVARVTNQRRTPPTPPSPGGGTPLPAPTSSPSTPQPQRTPSTPVPAPTPSGAGTPSPQSQRSAASTFARGAASYGISSAMQKIGLGPIAQGLGLPGSNSAQTKTNRDLEQAISGLQGASTEIKQASINNSLPGAAGSLQRIAGTAATIKDGDNLNNLSPTDIENIVGDTVRLAPSQMPIIKNISPETTAQIINKIKPPEQSQKKMGVFMTKEEIAKFSGHGELAPLAAKIMAEIKPDQMNAWTPDTAMKAVTSGIANSFWDGKKIAKAAELFGSKFVDTFRKNIKSPNYYAQNNKVMGSFISSSTGRALGLQFQKDESQPVAIKRQTPPAIAPRKPDSDIDLKKAA